jgi:hypothetical protein
MVYELADVRHPQLPLRLPHAETRAVVESLPVRCSHHDAFRFFSQSARPLNALQPDLDQRQELEQPACLHANMDLLKWALKLGAWIPSDLMAAAFRLAMDARVIDMRASPYDVSGLGLEAIAIETPAGRRAYIAEQRRIHDLGLGLRARLIDAMQRLFTLTELAA